MKSKNIVKLTACFLTGAVMISGLPSFVDAAAIAGITTTLSDTVKSKELKVPLSAGVSSIFSKYVLQGTNQAINSGMQRAQKDVAVVAAPEVAQVAELVPEVPAPVVSEYANKAVAKVENHVNVRTEPTIESAIAGKLYNNCVGTVVDQVAGWYRIQSGTLDGWVAAEYLVVGDEALVQSVGTKVATVVTPTLRVRKEATLESDIIGLVPGGEVLIVKGEQDGFVSVSINEGDGWVSSEFVTTKIVYKEAESAAEEAARLQREEQARKDAQKAVEKSQKKASTTTSNKSYTAPTGGDGSSVAAYASQFNGNRYVYGGSSLTNGTDCSGFVMSVYAAFGISLPHSSSALRSVGYGVDYSEAQPGDIICYSGHVGIYVGNGTIINASTPSTGIKYSSATYNTILGVRRIF